MEYTILPGTEVKVSKICLGTMTWGQQNTEAEGHEQLDHATTNGINFLDTAEMYSVPSKAETKGSTERIIGTWLKKRKKRDDLVIASKVCGLVVFLSPYAEVEVHVIVFHSYEIIRYLLNEIMYSHFSLK